MSRTDKDAPSWVRGLTSPTRTPSHHWYCDSDPTHLNRPWRHLDRSHPCDLDNPHTHGFRNACTWAPNDRDNYPYTRPPTRRERHMNYYGPERAAVRDSLRDAIRDYNTHGETDAEPPTRQARHSTWLGGWWD